MWRVLKKKYVSLKYLNLFRDMYDCFVTSLNFLSLWVCIKEHHLSLYLFALVMDDLTKSIQEEVP